MPRKPKGLPYVRVNRQGRLQYYRRVPADKRCFFQGRAAFTCVLDCDPAEPNGKAAYEAWSRANEEYEQRIAQEIAPDAPETALEEQQTPLSPRDAAGIAAEPLRNLLNAGESGQITQEMEDLLAVVALSAGSAGYQLATTGDMEAAEQAKTLITQAFVGKQLNQLQIKPDAAGMAEIQKRLLQYLQVAGADAAKREAGDFSPGELERIAPPAPQIRVAYSELIEQWLKDAGGFRKEKGSGVDRKRYAQYMTAVRELIQITGKHFPIELTIADVRGYINAIQASDKAIATKRARISTLTNLFAVGVRYGLLDRNVFQGMQIKVPKNTRQLSYRPFTKDELQLITKDLHNSRNQTRAMIAKALLATGARSSDVSQLRHRDVKQTDSGVYYFDFVDEPTDRYPHPLKGGASDERHTPLHPWLIDQGFLKYVQPNGEGFIFGEQKADLLSQWFQAILKRLGFYEWRVTGLHSLRGTWIDLMREARLPQDVRRAVTGHSSRDVQDAVYGEGLQKMPDVLHKELIKVDLAWLP